MNPEIKKRLLEALQPGSGYNKGTGYLCEILPNGLRAHCCLGVLTELYNQDHPDSPVEDLESLQLPPKKVLDWCEIEESRRIGVTSYDEWNIRINQPSFRTRNYETLAALNDMGPNRLIDFSDVIPEIEKL